MKARGMLDHEPVADSELVNPLALHAVLRTQPLFNIRQQPPRARQPENALEVPKTDVRARKADNVRAGTPNNCLVEGPTAAGAIRIVVQKAHPHTSFKCQ